jgi:hypothetical protein
VQRCGEAPLSVKGGGHVQVAVAVNVHVADHDQVNVNEVATNLWAGVLRAVLSASSSRPCTAAAARLPQWVAMWAFFFGRTPASALNRRTP